jgi:DNA ligase-1
VLQVCLFAFDCLYADGRTLLREPLSERRRLLYACCNETEGELQFAKERTRYACAVFLLVSCPSWRSGTECVRRSRDLEELTVFLDDSISANTEGAARHACNRVMRVTQYSGFSGLIVKSLTQRMSRPSVR